MTDIAARVNAWLSPATRKRIHAAIAALGIIAVIWGIPETLVTSWTALLLGVGGLMSAVLAAIMTRRADYTALYSSAAAVVGVLVVMRYLEPALAQQITQTLAAVVTLLGGVATMRTDPQTVDGAPTAEVVLTDMATIEAEPEPVVPVSVAYVDDRVITKYSDDSFTNEPGV